MLRINVEANKIWDLFQKEKAKLEKDFMEIAEDIERDVVIYLTSVGESGDELPDIIMCVGGEPAFEETCIDAADCEDIAKTMYRWATGKSADAMDDEPEEDEEEDEEEAQEEEIEMREEDLDYALYDFINLTIDESMGDFDSARKKKFFQDCKEHFLEYMYRKWDVTIYRPMYLVDENGVESYEEYPYELLDYEDEDNPIYMPE